MHRVRLKKMLAVRMGPKLLARVDPSDIVQEALLEASQHLAAYAREPTIPFYPWLRRIAYRRMQDAARRHVAGQRRSVRREQPWGVPLPEGSAVELADLLVASGTSPSRNLRREELRARVRTALAQLPAGDREVLILRYLEQLRPGEIAAVLEISERTVRSRHRRALDRMLALLDDTELSS